MYVDSKGRETAVICVTPIKNEAWILDRFLTLASEWADYIVIADQCSDDRSPEIAKSFEKVIYVLNEGEFDEQNRSQLLLNEVRRIKAAKKLIVCLDADEALTLNWDKSEDWNKMLDAEPKTVFLMDWIELFSKLKDDNIGIGRDQKTPFAYVDDKTSNFDSGVKFHLTRVPDIDIPNQINLNDLGNLHFKYLAKKRLAQRMAWYQIFEIEQKTNKNYITIFRQYNKVLGYNFIKNRVPLKGKLTNYSFKGDIYEVSDNDLTWHGKEVLGYLHRNGPEKYARLDIWNYDWGSYSGKIDNKNINSVSDPRNIFQILIHNYLRKTQMNCNNIFIKAIDYLLKTYYKLF
jgi:hypothetical protein